MEPVRLLDPAGELHADPEWKIEVTPELCRDFYRRMRLARAFDEEALALQRQGELGLWLQSSGQEAAQIGSVTALRPTDYIFPSYRDHAAALARGITPAELLVQWRGNRNSGWNPQRYQFHIYTLVLAAQLPHAVGYAMGVLRDGTDDVVAAYFGDGASSEGDASEALNWAAAGEVPLLFFCQNNQWAISTPPHIQMRSPLHERARGFGLDSYVVDGNDVLAVHAVTSAAVERIRANGRPAFIEAVTYRFGGHSTSDDPGRYREGSELARWKERDPITRMAALLENRGWADEDFRTALDEECRGLAEQTRSVCRTLPLAPLSTIFSTVLAEPTPLLAEERRRYEEFVASFAD
jgi:2-oxoisovalerate dehydrogenase E1 component alpha subunit